MAVLISRYSIFALDGSNFDLVFLCLSLVSTMAASRYLVFRFSYSMCKVKNHQLPIGILQKNWSSLNVATEI